MLTLLTLLAFFGDALAGDNVWTGIGPYTSYVVDAVVVDPSNPQVVYASSMNNGLWRSADGGTSWAYIGEGLHGGYVRDVAIDPRNPQTLYVGAYGGVDKSTDGGVSWQKVSQGMSENTYVFYLTMDPSNPRTLYAQSSTGVLFKTADGGASWTQIHSGKASFYKTLTIDLGNPRVLYFAAQKSDTSDQGIFKSVDGGASWTQIQAGIAASSLAIDPTNSQTLYAGASGGVYRSVDGGASWTRTHSDTLYVGAQRMTIRFLKIDPSSPQVIYAGTPNAVYKSTNGGASWAELSGLPLAQKSAYVGSDWTPDPISLGGLAMPASSPRTLYAGLNFDGAYKSVDGGNTWTKLRWGVNAASVLARASSRSGTLYTSGFAASASYLHRTADGGTSWTVILQISPSACAVDPSNPQIVYAASGNRGMFKSTDGGASWKDINSGLPTSVYTPSDRYVNALAIDPSNPQTVYASCVSYYNRTGNVGVYRTADGGASWQSLSAGLPSSRRLLALTLDPSHTQTLYAGFDSLGVYRTTDGGASWASFSAGIPANITVRAFAFDPAQTQTLYAGTSGGIYKTTDGGTSWKEANAGLPASLNVNALAADPFRPQTLYAGTSGGVYKTADGGASWTSFNVGLPVKSVISLVLDPSEQKLYAGASPGGVYVIHSADIGGRLLGDFDGSGEVNFDDFFLFAAAFGQRATGDSAKFDLDGSGEVGLSDFFLFADRFGQRAP
jgi:photosystem II stability/assembly factor-like uncharacterized protein